MKRKIFFAFALIMTISIGCSKQNDETVEKAVPVKIYKVKSESISKYIRTTGSVMAEEDVIVYSKISECVEKVNVMPGQSVLKNQVLVEQKNETLKQGLGIANSALKTAEAQTKLAANDFERMKKLYSEKAISSQQYDLAKTAQETSEHAFEQAKSLYEQAKEQYENSFVKAPFDGIVAAVYVENNQMINIGQPVVQVLSPSKMKAKIKLTGDDVQNAKVGQKVAIKFPTLHEDEFTGRVDKINTAIDQMSKSLEVEVVLLSKDNRIKSGMFGEFMIETKNIASCLVIPEAALISQTEIKIDRNTGLQSTLKKYYLFVIEKNIAKMREVKTGIANNGQIEISDGLSIGDAVVVVGQNIVKEGQAVNIID